MSHSTLFPAKYFDERFLIVCSDTTVFRYDGTLWSDITGPSVYDTINQRWSGGWLNGSLTLANQRVVRTYQEGLDTETQPMEYDHDAGTTWEGLSYSAHCFRPFREFMFAMNVDQNGTDYPVRVQWCDPVEPGQVPRDWEPKATNLARDVNLADTPGGVVDGHPLRDTFIIYKEDSIYACNFIGGNDVFSFRRITTNKGLYARDCVVEYQGRHWCQGAGDVFMMDANEPMSILWGRNKQSWLAAMDPDRAKNNWALLDPLREEILFGYVSKNAPPEQEYPDQALVLCMRNSAIFTRDYECEMPHAKAMLSVANQTRASSDVYAIDRTNDRVLILEAAPDRLGLPVSAQIQRAGLYAQPAHDFVQVNGLRANLKGANASMMLGNQLADDAPISWRDPFTLDPATDYKTDARQNGNQIAYDIKIDATTEWQLASLSLLIGGAGSRG